MRTRRQAIEWPDFWRGAQAVLATQHQKERAVARPFRSALGLQVLVPPDLDTDQLGTFSGERPRPGSPLETVLMKARLGMTALGLRVGLASEGSFGPHPASPLLPGSTEWLAFVDDERGLQIVERLTTSETNFSHIVVGPGDKLDRFLMRARFPSHALVVRPNDGDGAVRKALASRAELDGAILESSEASRDGRARIETDMRAHLNPTRMRVIRRVAFRLVRRLATACPACRAPGFGMAETEAGLPCESCGSPTDFVAREIWLCGSCGYREVRGRFDGRSHAPASACPHCNP